jgi:hypothetical protein
MPRLGLGLSLLCGTLSYSLLSTPVYAACIPNTTDTPGLQNYLTSGGQSYTLSLCQGEVYNLTDILNYTAPYQVSHCSLAHIVHDARIAHIAHSPRKSRQRGTLPMVIARPSW